MAYRSNGTATDRIEIRTDSFPQWFPAGPNDPYTVMAWFKRATDTALNQCCIHIGHATDNDLSHNLTTGSGGNSSQQQVYDGDNSNTTSVNQLSTGEWFHYAMIANPRGADVVRSSHNGGAGVPNTVRTLDTPNQKISLLGQPEFSGEVVDGWVAEFKYWPFAFTQTTAGAVTWPLIRAEMFAKGPIQSPEQCAYFPLDGQHGLFDAQNRGMSFSIVTSTSDVFADFGEHPPGLLPAAFFQRQMMQHNPVPDANTVFPRVRKGVF